MQVYVCTGSTHVVDVRVDQCVGDVCTLVCANEDLPQAEVCACVCIYLCVFI